MASLPSFFIKVAAILLFANPISTYSIVPVLYDSSNNLHRDMQYHPEQPARIETCVTALQGVDNIELQDVASDASFSGSELSHARSMLVKAHSEDFVSNLETRCRGSKERRIAEGKPALGFVGHIDDDTYVTTETFDVCLRATATWIRAVDVTMASGGQPTMALTRPPGHHATKTLANGFCLFNFAAAAALHALQTRPNIRLSMLDWDVHYGQGVADILKDQSRARYVSIHQLHAFPYMGEKFEVSGEHQNIMTVPISAETTWTCGYQQAMMEKALPFVRTAGEWEPDLVMVCSGYDALDSDELASVSLQAPDYGRMVRALRNHIGSTGLMLGMEGGYQLREGAGGGNLADAVVETVKALSE
jgi:acetoin utilization deacetylase AcuC-like enzyme